MANEPLRTNIGEASAWRAGLRAEGVERRPPPNKPEPDRKHVDRQPPGPRRVVMTTADKPPQQLNLQPSPPPEPPNPPPAPAAKQFYNPEFRAQVVSDFFASRRSEPHLTQEKYAERLGINQTTLSNWLSEARAEQSRREAAALRREARAARASAEPARSFESVSCELAEAIGDAKEAAQRVQRLKAELRALLDEGES